MLELKELHDAVQNSKEFKEWHKKNSDFYLCSFFTILNEQGWQVDYYSPSKDRIASFTYDKKIKILDTDSKIFKKEGLKVDKLNLDDIKINLKKALDIVIKLRDKKYKNEKANKIIIILQNIKKPLWNITYLTSTFNILNVKIDAKSGKILEEKIMPALSFKSQ
jgi:Zn-dependent metalloprotease